MERRLPQYIVSKDSKSGLYYAHHRNLPHVPVFGSFDEKRSVSAEYAKMMNVLPNKVEQIEAERKAKYMKWLNE